MDTAQVIVDTWPEVASQGIWLLKYAVAAIVPTLIAWMAPQPKFMRRGN